MLILPDGYKSRLTVRETEHAIKLVKDRFERELAAALNLNRVSAPLFVRPESGLNDNLNGFERPVAFDIKDLHSDVEIVHSLAKWKRMALKKYGYGTGEGLYTDMNVIRRDEDLDNLHSVYVDQWDWELILKREERTEEKLRWIVHRIYDALVLTQDYIHEIFPRLGTFLARDIKFIHSEELLQMYPNLSAKERELAICKKYGSVFIIGIGGKLSNGERHDGRAPDYDDWSLNGDILIHYPVLDCALEISSMGIRVDAASMKSQLETAGLETRAELPFHKAVLADSLPLTAGGGIGQSRLCMMLLGKAHIGEVQASIWPKEMIKKCHEDGIELL